MALRKYKRDRNGRFAKGNGGGPGRGNKGGNSKKAGKRTASGARKQGRLQKALIKRRKNNAINRKNMSGKSAGRKAVVVNQQNKASSKSGGTKVGRKKLTPFQKDIAIRAGVGLAFAAVSIGSELSNPNSATNLRRGAQKRDKAKFGPPKSRRNYNRAAKAGFKVRAYRNNRKFAKVVFPGDLGMNIR